MRNLFIILGVLFISISGVYAEGVKASFALARDDGSLARNGSFGSFVLSLKNDVELNIEATRYYSKELSTEKWVCDVKFGGFNYIGSVSSPPCIYTVVTSMFRMCHHPNVPLARQHEQLGLKLYYKLDEKNERLDAISDQLTKIQNCRIQINKKAKKTLTITTSPTDEILDVSCQ